MTEEELSELHDKLSKTRELREKSVSEVTAACKAYLVTCFTAMDGPLIPEQVQNELAKAMSDAARSALVEIINTVGLFRGIDVRGGVEQYEQYKAKKTKSN